MGPTERRRAIVALLAEAAYALFLGSEQTPRSDAMPAAAPGSSRGVSVDRRGRAR